MSAMLIMYAKCGRPQEALKRWDNCSNIPPNSAMYGSVLTACANLGSAGLEKGNEIIRQLVANKDIDFVHDMKLRNAALNMYLKCGAVERAAKMWADMKATKTYDVVTETLLLANADVMTLLGGLHSMGEGRGTAVRDTKYYNTVISQYTKQGYYDRALATWEDMCKAEVKYDLVTLNCVLLACAQAGRSQLEVGEHVCGNYLSFTHA